ncbi:MAG: DUF1376 domain-containing protein [Alphaproteobacteria bacterium]|nr:DUF1376 domain-containing protein [Alphaproteobacteria bacterium]
MLDSPAAGRAPPPIPAEVDLKDFRFMPIDVLTIRDSPLTIGDPAIFRATLMLWFVAWHQLPAGSLDPNDDWLAHRSGAGADWPRIRDTVLAGFVEHADGRLYHPLLTEKVLQAWGRKRTKTLHKAADCQRKAEARNRPQPEPAPDPAPPPPEAASPDSAAPDPAAIVFRQGLSWLQQASGRSAKQCRPLLGKWRAAVGDEALIVLLGRAQREGVIDPVGWIEKAVAAHKAHHDPPQPTGWN